MHYANVYGLKEKGSDKLIAIRIKKGNAEKLANKMNNESGLFTLPEKVIHFICFCEEFDLITGRKYPKKDWYAKNRIQPKKEWIEQHRKFYIWFYKQKFGTKESYYDIVLKYFKLKNTNNG